MRRTSRIAGLLAAVLIGAGAYAAPAAAVGSPAQAGPGGTPQSVTLITGDVVTLGAAANGKVAATVRPAPGRENVTFQTVETDGGMRVVPVDAVPLISSGRVDPGLFDVQRLIADGYGDAGSATMPLIVQGGDSSALRAQSGSDRTLASLGAVALRTAKSALAGFWQQQTGPTTRSAAPRHIWLDGKVHATLDGSAEQIGAPTAWRAGVTGTGVKVAVLDTGIDAGHADFAGRIAAKQNFSTSADTVDRFGHGTHVASIVAGVRSGHTGVAPGASLLVGKVLDDDGAGYESDIIAGMQWAVAQGAKVVNMSLGGDVTDGTDPMSLAVDEISASSGALFVVAAGNSGADNTVGTPGAAKSALTVGAVDADDNLAEFSSRGPRLGDQGLKPEITAPGVAIVAARAAGTTLGDPVSDTETALSGTSMATPHVAGAAALLAAAHPGWTGPQIKNALVSTAKTRAGTSVYAQGAGRVDVARAITQHVTGTGVADFGEQQRDATPPTRRITYTNDGATPVTLTLTAPAGVTLSATTLSVPAAGTAAVDATLQPAKVALGTFSGWVTATAAGGVLVTTAAGAMVDGPHHTLTVRALDRAGKPTVSPAMTLFGDDSRSDVLGWLDAGANTFDVQEGSYFLDALIEQNDPQDEQVTYVMLPEINVTGDVTVVVDARKGRPIRIETPKPAEQRAVLSYYSHRITGTGRDIQHGVMHFSTVQAVNVAPTAKVKEGSFEFSSRWQLEAPLVTASVPGVAGLDLNPVGQSPLTPGTRRYPLVVWGAPSVRGKVVLLPSSPDVSEEDQIATAIAAGAAAAIGLRPADRSHWTVWHPDGDRLAVPAFAAKYDDGQRLLRRAAKSGATITLTLTPSSPYLYDVFQVSKDRVPDQIVYKVTAANSQRIATSYADNGGFDWVREQRFGWRPWQTYSWNDAERDVRTPSVREEWVSAGDSVWQHRVSPDYPWGDGALASGLTDQPRGYRAGRSAETWASPVVRPATPAGVTSARTGDVLNLRVADFVDSSGAHSSIGEADRASATLWRDGKVLAQLPDAWRNVPTTPGDAAYRLVLDTARGGEDWSYGTRTTSEWTFRSAAGRAALPLLQVSYDVPAGLTGTATTRAHLVRLGVAGHGTKLTAEESADDGVSWKPAVTAGRDGAFTALVPAGRAPVSLRVTASDKAGDSVRQTVIRAYGRA